MWGVKTKLRETIKTNLAGLSGEQLAEASDAIASRLTALDEFRQARVVMLYLPIRGEVAMLSVARQAWGAGQQVVCPTACDHCRSMRAILCTPQCEAMFAIGHGLRQPDRQLGELSVSDIDLVVVPGLAYDRAGNRLGRGGGFYDRFLARQDLNAWAVGVAFAEQIVENLPMDPYDRAVDLVVTDREIIRPEALKGTQR